MPSVRVTELCLREGLCRVSGSKRHMKEGCGEEGECSSLAYAMVLQIL